MNVFPNLSRLGLGTASSGLNENHENATKVLYRLAESLGEKQKLLVDTAQIYPGSEEWLGNLIEKDNQLRERLFIVSKCGHHDIMPDGSLRSRPISTKDIELALSKLKIDRLDAMLLHSYDGDLLKHGDAWQTLQSAKDKGQISLGRLLRG